MNNNEGPEPIEFYRPMSFSEAKNNIDLLIEDGKLDDALDCVVRYSEQIQEDGTWDENQGLSMYFRKKRRMFEAQEGFVGRTIRCISLKLNR